ncbi:lipid droplet-associated protein [Actinomycetospora straminea]|uniref:Lipid droplet-associated protein n=1 Tax=Actinomycetospora straminea TaxID=663607 RepID=A0ABP9DY11_9PSEU|nr:lipid droplet-associated protein [Actinomycetospora straminea]MDD7930884.1 lipid droplet-associated protein [Actinomycetospora straminea]
MSSLPFPVRVAAGLVVTAVEEAKDLPRTVAGLPITAVSRVLQMTMRAQQVVTELAIKGDTALDGMRPVEEAPSWARFDDDLPEALPSGYASYEVDDTSLESTDLAGTPRVNGHASAPALGVVGEDGETASVTPDVLPGYESMTIAQLRGKLRSLSVEDVEELLAWEQAHAARPPFVTMLSNRIATLHAE